jgi:hypothetical protein
MGIKATGEAVDFRALKIRQQQTRDDGDSVQIGATL